MSICMRPGRPEEYERLIDFANLVFEEDFRALLPKLYGGHAENAAHHLVLEDGGELQGLLCRYPLQWQNGGHTLAVQGIGTVAVHPAARGKGHMQRMMAQAIADAKRDGADLLCLGGQRQRYEYFGFGCASARCRFDISPDNLRHLPPGSLTLAPLAAQSDWLGACLRLHGGQGPHMLRARQSFAETLASWHHTPWVLLHEGEFAGYASIKEGGASVQELLLADEHLAPQAARAFVQHAGQTVSIHVGAHQRGLLAALDAFAEGACTGYGNKLCIVNYPRVIEAMLALKLQETPLADGRLCLEVAGEGRWDITVENGRATVRESAAAPDWTLAPHEAVRLLFSPMAAGRQGLAAQWFPPPFSLPLADMV